MQILSKNKRCITAATVFLVAALLVLGACGEAGYSVVGTWKPDGGEIRLVFSADGSFANTNTASGQLFQGTWEITRDGELVLTTSNAQETFGINVTRDTLYLNPRNTETVLELIRQ